MYQFNLINCIEAHGRQDAKKLAYIEPDGRQITYQDLHRDIQKAIKFLFDRCYPDGVVTKKTMTLRCGNCIEFSIWCLAAIELGMDVLVLPIDTSENETIGLSQKAGSQVLVGAATSVLKDSGVFKKFIALNSYALVEEAAWPTQRTCGGAVLLASSGSTGKPRLIKRTAQALDAMADMGALAMRFKRQRVMGAVPLAHSYGLEHGLLIPLFDGSTVLLCPGMDSKALLTQLGRGATVFPAVPSMVELLPTLDGAKQASFALRLVYSAGGPLPVSAYDDFYKIFKLRVGQIFGASEIGSVTFNDPDDKDFNPQTIGKPMGGVCIQLLECDETGQGKLAIYSPAMFEGYLGHSQQSTEHYFLTGDLARPAGSASFVITGRIGLLVNIGGRKVNPLEVEKILSQHPQVSRCLIGPVRQAASINRLRAIVVAKQPANPPAPDSLRAFVKKHLADYKVPRLIEFRENLPLTTNGKVARLTLENQ